MAYPRVLTIQDISCVGQCSMAVALPILSACGLETCLLPTALLSTHTGGFGKPAVVHFDERLTEIWHHWKECGITFDGILVGYLGSVQAVETAGQILEELLAPGGVAIVDPVMGDHGKLYSGFDETYVQAVKKLCAQADVLLPNETEVRLLTGRDDEEDPKRLLSALGCPCVVLTGVEEGPDAIGVHIWQEGQLSCHTHPRIPQNFHGTGDIFAAVLTGALLQGRTLTQAAAAAADFTYRCIADTAANPAHWYGVKFEPLLPLLGEMSGNSEKSWENY